MIEEDNKKEIVRILNERIQKFECPLCHEKRFSLVDGYFNFIIQDNILNNSLSGKGIPSVGIICDNCGFISHHALGSLGLLDKFKNIDQPET